MQPIELTITSSVQDRVDVAAILIKNGYLDALVRSKILKGDSPKYVIGSPSFTRYEAKYGCRVLVTIIEDENEDRLRWKLRNASDTITEGVE